MTKQRTDSAGNVVEIGDIVASFARSKYSSGFDIAKVAGVFESGRVTGKTVQERQIYAYEEGAPDITQTRKVSRLKPGVESRGWRNVSTDYEWVEEEYTTRDYTVVGRKKYWRTKQLADISLLILRKHDGTDVLNLQAGANINWDAEIPE